MKSIKLMLFIAAIMSVYSAFAQGEIDKEKEIFFRNERTWAPQINTNGYGLDFTYNKRINGFNWRSYSIDFMELKNKKELKAALFNQGSKYAFGKVNYFYALKFTYGKTHEMYSKQDAGGISIRKFYGIGPTLGIKKPIYYYITVDKTNLKIVKFDNTLNTSNIYDNAPYYIGLNEISLVPGIHAKFGYSFDFSKQRNSISCVEAGIVGDVFLNTVDIMAENNKFYFFALYASYRFGKIIDKSYIKKDEVDYSK